MSKRKEPHKEVKDLTFEDLYSYTTSEALTGKRPESWTDAVEMNSAWVHKVTKGGKIVVMKMFSPDKAKRGFTEAKILDGLVHPNIIALLDLQWDTVHDGNNFQTTIRLFFPMYKSDLHEYLLEYREQKTLVPSKTAFTLLQQLLSALEYTHAQGYVHGDVKPDNVLVADNPHGGIVQVCLSDYDLAQEQTKDEKGSFTGVGKMITGTDGYKAPELMYERLASSVKSDVFSLGLIVYELRTGKSVYESFNFMAWRVKHGYGDSAVQWPAVDTTDPHASFLQQACQRCLHVTPGKRPSAGVLLRQCEEMLAGPAAAEAPAAAQAPSAESLGSDVSPGP